MVDTKSILICPACGNIMEKVYLSNVDMFVDICTDGCGGIYFDNREAESLNVEKGNFNIILSKIEGKNFIPVDETKVRICPSCGAVMTKIGAAGGEVTVDVCYTCGGQFLDNGEFQKIHSNNAKSIDEAIFEMMAQKSASTHKIPRRTFFEDMIKKFL